MEPAPIASAPTCVDETSFPSGGDRTDCGPYQVLGRLAVYPQLEILAARHRFTGQSVVLRRQYVTNETFCEDARKRAALCQPPHLPFCDYAHDGAGGAYQAYALPASPLQSVQRDPRDLPAEEWIRLAQSAAAAIQEALHAGIAIETFEPAGLWFTADRMHYYLPLAPATRSNPLEVTRSLAGWLCERLSLRTGPAGGSGFPLQNPRVPQWQEQLLYHVLTAAPAAPKSPGELARRLSAPPEATRPTVHPQVSGVDTPTIAMHAPSAGPIGAAEIRIAAAWAVVLALGGLLCGWFLANL